MKAIRHDLMERDTTTLLKGGVVDLSNGYLDYKLEDFSSSNRGKHQPKNTQRKTRSKPRSKSRHRSKSKKKTDKVEVSNQEPTLVAQIKKPSKYFSKQNLANHQRDVHSEHPPNRATPESVSQAMQNESREQEDSVSFGDPNEEFQSEIAFEHENSESEQTQKEDADKTKFSVSMKDSISNMAVPENQFQKETSVPMNPLSQTPALVAGNNLQSKRIEKAQRARLNSMDHGK